jgi:hypothetical protein
MQKLTYTVLIMLLLIAHNSFAGRIGANIALRPNITFQLNKVLLSSENLRIALLNQDEDQIEICLKELSWEVDQARNISLQVRDFDRRHLLKILDNIKGSLEISFSSRSTFLNFLLPKRSCHMDSSFKQTSKSIPWSSKCL